VSIERDPDHIEFYHNGLQSFVRIDEKTYMHIVAELCDEETSRQRGQSIEIMLGHKQEGNIRYNVYLRLMLGGGTDKPLVRVHSFDINKFKMSEDIRVGSIKLETLSTNPTYDR